MADGPVVTRPLDRSDKRTHVERINGWLVARTAEYLRKSAPPPIIPAKLEPVAPATPAAADVSPVATPEPVVLTPEPVATQAKPAEPPVEAKPDPAPAVTAPDSPPA